MPAFKRHHFVPQFYLRNFATDERQRQVGLFEFSRSLFVPQTSIRSQAQRTKLYGDDAHEKCLSDLEGLAAGIIRTAIERRELPKRYSPFHGTLLIYVLFQASRTPAAGAEIEELTEQLVKTVMSHNEKLAPHLDGIRVHYAAPLKITMGNAALNYRITADLCYKLLVNKSAVPFITSDHPTVFYNQFMERRDKFGSSTGLACKGLQVFLPLSSKVCLVLFDSAVYRVGGRSLKGVQVEATLDDVTALNSLQVANAQNQLFFSGEISESEIRRTVERSIKFRPARRATIAEYPATHARPDGLTSTLIHSSKVDLRVGLRLSKVSELPSVASYEVGSRVFHPRDETLCRLHEDFVQKVRDKKYRASEWGRFLDDICDTEQANPGRSSAMEMRS